MPQKLMHKLERKAQRRAGAKGGASAAAAAEPGDADADWVRCSGERDCFTASKQAQLPLIKSLHLPVLLSC